MSNRDKAIGNGPHILLYGLFGIGNTGNDATLEVTLAELRRHHPGARFTVVTTNPEIVHASFGEHCVAIRSEAARSPLPGPAGTLAREWGRWAEAHALLRSADCLIVPGTGILDDFGATVMGHAYQLWRWCAAAKRVGAPVKFVAVGAGPAERAWSRRFFRMAAAVADHRSYRDEGSRAFVRDVLGLDTARDGVTPDLVFGLDFEAPAPSGRIETVGLGVMDYHGWLGGEDPAQTYQPYMVKLAAFGAGLLNGGKAVRILVGDTGDQAVALDLRARLLEAAPHGRVSVAAPPTLRGLCAEIAQLDAVVATRYHTIVGALMCGRPAVSIGYAAKNAAVMEAFGVGGYCQNIRDYDLATLERHFAEATADSGAAYAQLRAAAERLKGEVRAHCAGVAGEIARRGAAAA